MKRRRLLSIMSVALTGALFLTGCGSSSAKEDENVFRVGMEAGFAPYNWTQMDDSNGAVKIDGSTEYAGGYDVEMAKKIADALGKELVIVKTEWDGLIPALNSDKIDAIIAGMASTAERQEAIDFTNAYHDSKLVLVVKSDGSYANATSLKDFNGAKVTAQLNTFHYDLIDQIEGVKKQPAIESFPTMRVAIESGLSDAYVSTYPEGVSAQYANSNLKMIETTDEFLLDEEKSKACIGIKKNSELTEKINKILSEIPNEEKKELMDNAILNQPAAQ